VFRMRWPNVTGKDPPKSVCSEPCEMGHVRSYAVSQADADKRWPTCSSSIFAFHFQSQDACCWSCVRCRDDSVVVGEDQCKQCPLGYVPSQKKVRNETIHTSQLTLMHSHKEVDASLGPMGEPWVSSFIFSLKAAAGMMISLLIQDQCLLMDAYPLDWESPWVFFPVVVSSIGICVTVDVFAVFILYNR
jgi:hypothetical protein